MIIEASRIKPKRVEVEKKEIKPRKRCENNNNIVLTENKFVEAPEVDHKKLKRVVDQINGDNYEENLSEIQTKIISLRLNPLQLTIETNILITM